MELFAPTRIPLELTHGSPALAAARVPTKATDRGIVCEVLNIYGWRRNPGCLSVLLYTDTAICEIISKVRKGLCKALGIAQHMHQCCGLDGG